MAAKKSKSDAPGHCLMRFFEGAEHGVLRRFRRTSVRQCVMGADLKFADDLTKTALFTDVQSLRRSVAGEAATSDPAIWELEAACGKLHELEDAVVERYPLEDRMRLLLEARDCVVRAHAFDGSESEDH